MLHTNDASLLRPRRPDFGLLPTVLPLSYVLVFSVIYCAWHPLMGKGKFNGKLPRQRVMQCSWS